MNFRFFSSRNKDSQLANRTLTSKVLRAFLRLLKIGFFLLICLLGLVFASTLLLFSTWGQPLLIGWLHNELKQHENFHIAVEQIRASGPRTLSITEFSLINREGKRLLYTPELTLSFSLWQLLRGQLPLKRVAMKKLELHASAFQKDSEGPALKSFAIPAWALAGDLSLAIGKLQLIETPLDPLALRAQVSWSPISQSVSLKIEERHECPKPRASILLSDSAESLLLDESDGSLIQGPLERAPFASLIVEIERHFDEYRLEGHLSHGEWLKIARNQLQPLCQNLEIDLHANAKASSFNQLLQNEWINEAITGQLQINCETVFGPASLNSGYEIEADYHFKSSQLRLTCLGWEAFGQLGVGATTKSFDLALGGPFQLDKHPLSLLKAIGLESSDFKPLEPTLKGAKASLELSGSLEQYEGFFDIHADQLDIPAIDETFESPAFWAQLRGGSEREKSAELAFSFGQDEQPFSATGRLNYEADQWKLHSIKATAAGLDLTIEPSIDSENPGWSLTTHLDWQRSLVSRMLAKQFKMHAASLELFAHYSLPSELSPQAAIDYHGQLREFSSRGLHCQNMESTGHVRLDHSLSLGWPSFDVESFKLHADQLTSGSITVADSFDWFSWGNSNALYFQLQAGRSNPFEADASSYAIHSQGLLGFSENRLRLALEEINGHWSGLPLQMERSCLVEIDPKRLSCSDFELLFGGGRLDLDGHWSQKEAKLEAKFHKVPLDLISLISGRELWGEATGSFEFEVDEESSTGKAALELLDLRTQKESNPNSNIQGELEFDWLQDKLKLHSRLIRGPEQLLGEIKGDWQALTHPESWASFGAHQPHDLNLILEGKLGLFSRHFTIEDFDFDGQVLAHLHTWGEPANVSVEGEIKIDQGSYDHYPIGLTLKEVTAHLRGEGQTLVLDQLHAKDGDRGYATAQGTLFLSGGLRSHSRLQFNHFRFINIPLATSWATGEGEFNHRGYAAELKGSLKLDKTLVRLPETLPSLIPELQDYRLVRWPSDEVIGTSNEKMRSFMSLIDAPIGTILYDLYLELPPLSATLSGKGLTSAWKGHLHLTGHSEKLQLNGQISLQKGDFLFAGRRFQAEEGEVQFNGDPTLDTQMRIASELALEQVRIKALLSGSLTHPKLQFQSVPGMAPADLFSHLLFGQSYSNLNAFQALQVAQLALEASGDPTVDLFGQIRKSTGFDRIEIESKRSGVDTSEGDIYSLRLGKYLRSGLLVGINKDVSTQGTQVTLQLDLTQHLSILAELGYLSNSSLNLMWKKDY